MATTEQPLTEREQEGLEHMRKAQELGVTLKEYAATFGLDVQKLYQLRKPLVRKGALGLARSETKKVPKAEKASAFLPVRVVPSPPRSECPSVMCRLVHPSGWVLEFDGLPPASWVTAVVAGGVHAAA